MLLSPVALATMLVLDPIPPPSSDAPRAPVLSGSFGLELARGEEGFARRWGPWLAEGSFRLSWMPLPWLGLTGDAYFATIVETFPWGWGAGARVGPVLRWPLGWGPISPFVSAQAGVVGVFLLGAGADGGKAGVGGHELSVEAGVDIPVKEFQRDPHARRVQTFLSISGRAGTMNFDVFEARFWSGRVALGAGF